MTEAAGNVNSGNSNVERAFPNSGETSGIKGQAQTHLSEDKVTVEMKRILKELSSPECTPQAIDEATNALCRLIDSPELDKHDYAQAAEIMHKNLLRLRDNVFKFWDFLPGGAFNSDPNDFYSQMHSLPQVRDNRLKRLEDTLEEISSLGLTYQDQIREAVSIFVAFANGYPDNFEIFTGYQAVGKPNFRHCVEVEEYFCQTEPQIMKAFEKKIFCLDAKAYFIPKQNGPV